MTGRSLKELRSFLEANEDLVDIGTPASEEKILEAERFLGITFPEDYRTFLREWGTLSIGPMEYYGIAGQSFEKSSVPNGIWLTSVKRGEVELPADLIIISSNEGDEYVCLDLKVPDDYQIVVWDVTLARIVSTRSIDLFRYIIEDVADFI